MREYLPILIVGAIIGVFATVFLVVYLLDLRRKNTDDGERHMRDGEIVRRLLAYARPYWKDFVLVMVIMLVSIVYDVISPLLVGKIQGIVKGDFALKELYAQVAVYAGILVVRLI